MVCAKVHVVYNKQSKLIWLRANLNCFIQYDFIFTLTVLIGGNHCGMF